MPARLANATDRKGGDDGPVGAWEREDVRAAIEPAFRRLYAVYEWLRDDASPFDAMTACRLQSPNWWRTACDALAAARVQLDDPPQLPSDGNQTGVAPADPARRMASTACRVFEAAVALRLPYDALQPGEAWAMGWHGAWREMASGENGAPMIAACRTLLAAAGSRSRRDGLPPDRLAAALDHAEHASAVCYTERQKPSWT